MSKVIVDFDWKYYTLSIHSDVSLSGLVNALESMTGTVLVTQPNIYELEAYLDPRWYNTSERKKELQNKLSFTFRQFDIPIEYVEN